jgi:hypothetical protein
LDLPLSVDTAGLKQGADRSVAIASDLAERGDDASGSGSQPSHAGVAALHEAVISVRTRQARRVELNAKHMIAGADAYAATDAQAEERLAESV